MGSNTPPGSSVTLTPAATSSTSATNVDQNNAEQLRRLLEQKEQEIRSLKFELEKYKLALRQAQADNKQRVLFTTGGPSTDEGKAGDVRRLEEQDDEDDDDDLGEIDLHVGAGTASDIDEGEKISASGLTFTDAAISNLNQLAALQERCESQQHSHSQQQQQQPPPTSAAGTTATAAVPPPIELVTQTSSSSVSPNSTIHQADLNSNQSLANVVAAAAAAAVAAAAESDNHLHHHHQQQHHDPTHQLQQQPQSTDPTRSISSALSSPEFFQNLHHQHHLNQHQQQRQQAHQTGMHQQSMSPLTSLHFSPSTSITQSPSSLLAQARRSNSNTSTCSGFMSPISSPNYLRRQFMPDRLPMMSPSPSSLTTGSSSAASTSLAHILQQQVYQQRSVSALAGPITSPSSTPLSSTGSNAVSPLIGSKNSSQVRLNNMQIRHKFGYLGSSRGQFNSPHGFCLGLNQEIVVADTNNHRVCIFDKSGTYLTQFGSPGKEEGQLWNPRKVAILHRPSSGGVTSGVSSSSSAAATNLHRNSISSYSSHFTNAGGIQSITTPGSGAIVSGSSLATTAQGGGGGGGFASEPLYVVCDRGAERSRMQLFTKDGSFIKKIAIHYIDIVAGLAITQNGLIIVVDSVSPTVYIINAETGTLNGWFDCSGHMKEPSDIAVKSDLPGNEYFICDFKGHCVVVFSEHGDYLRRIGHDGLTSYPNGIDISDDGDILVGDSHGNRFHVVVFDRNGLFVSQFECPHVKVSRCCGLKITREGYIVTLAKNNHHVLVLDTIHI